MVVSNGSMDFGLQFSGNVGPGALGGVCLGESFLGSGLRLC